MKKKLLIITEDIVKIQTFSGKLGRNYSFFYRNFLKLKIYLLINLLKSKYHITLLTSDTFSFKSINTLYYSQSLDLDRTVKLKPLSWKLTSEIVAIITKVDKNFTIHQSIPLIKLWENKISSQIQYNYLSYLELIDRFLKSKKYDAVLIIGNSLQEKLTRFYAKKYHLKLINLSWPNLNFVTNWLFTYFRHRELTKKINDFKIQSLKPKPSLKSLSSPILLSVDFYRHLKTLVPIYKQLKKSKANPLFITNVTSLKNHLKNFKIKDSNYLFLANFLPKDFFDNHLASWKKTSKKIHQHVKHVVNGKPSKSEDFFQQLVFPEISPIIKHGLILSRLYLVAGEQLFKTMKPRNIVIAADIRLTELTLSYLAKKYQIPSLTVSPRTMMFDEETYKYDTTDFISVTGNHARDKLLKFKVPLKRIRVLGDPRYDYFKQLEKKFSRSKIYKQLHINDLNKKIVLLISDRPNAHFPKEEKRDIFLLLSKAVKSIDQAVLIVKPHPTEKRFRVLEELKQWGITNAIVSDNNQLELFDLLKASSVIVTAWSMTGLEAMILNRPVMIVNPYLKNYDKFIPYVKNSAAIQVSSVKEATNSLQILIDQRHPQTKKLLQAGQIFSQYYVKKPDGKVSQKIANLILKAS